MISEVFSKATGWDAVMLWFGVIVFAFLMVYILFCIVCLLLPKVALWMRRTGEKIICDCNRLSDVLQMDEDDEPYDPTWMGWEDYLEAYENRH